MISFVSSSTNHAVTATQVRSCFHALIDRMGTPARLNQMYDALVDVEGLPDEITDELA